jgi:hypothetical protein
MSSPAKVRSRRPLALYFPEQNHADALIRDEELLMNVAQSRPQGPVKGMMGDQVVLASYLGGDDDCRVVAITYGALKLSETWQVCASGQMSLLREAEPLPDLTNNAEFVSIRQTMTHSAYATGLATWRDDAFLIVARAVSPPDGNACRLVETVVTWQGRAVELLEEQICSQVEP